MVPESMNPFRFAFKMIPRRQEGIDAGILLTYVSSPSARGAKQEARDPIFEENSDDADKGSA